MFKSSLGNKGFSLVEILIALGVGVIMLWGISSIQIYTLKSNESNKQDISFSQMLGELHMVLKSPSTCSDALKNVDPSSSEIKLFKPGTNQSESLYEKGSKFDKWTIDSIKFSSLSDLVADGSSKLGTISIKATKDSSVALGVNSRTQDFLVKIKLDASSKIESCWSERDIKDACQEIGGDYSPTRTPSCLITSADLGNCSAGQTITGFDSNGNKICTDIASLTKPPASVEMVNCGVGMVVTSVTESKVVCESPSGGGPSTPQPTTEPPPGCAGKSATCQMSYSGITAQVWATCDSNGRMRTRAYARGVTTGDSGWLTGTYAASRFYRNKSWLDVIANSGSMTKLTGTITNNAGFVLTCSADFM